MAQDHTQFVPFPVRSSLLGCHSFGVAFQQAAAGCEAAGCPGCQRAGRPYQSLSLVVAPTTLSLIGVGKSA